MAPNWHPNPCKLKYPLLPPPTYKQKERFREESPTFGGVPNGIRTRDR